MLGRMFQPASWNDALQIASQSLLNSGSGIRLICHDTKPARFRIYADPPEPCWWVEVQGGNGKEGSVIRSSRVIVIGRQTGTIHYDGPAGDEGYHRHYCSVDQAAPRIGLTTASFCTAAQYTAHSLIKAARLANCDPR